MTFPTTRHRASRPEIPDVRRVPWSVLGPEFTRDWGRPNGENNPEHVEILGTTGSGKTYLEATMLQDRAIRRHSGIIVVCTKPADKTILKLGWPVVGDWRGVRRHEQVIFWPRTKALGARRKAFQAARIQDLLDRLWTPDSNNVIAFDEFAYVQGLTPDLRDTLDIYLREGRSSGISLVLMKQRPQGVTREMHAETQWKASFRPMDHDDAERTAQLFGSKREWTPILEQLNPENHEFLIQRKLTGASFISWVDTPIRAARQQRGYR